MAQREKRNKKVRKKNRELQKTHVEVKERKTHVNEKNAKKGEQKCAIKNAKINPREKVIVCLTRKRKHGVHSTESDRRKINSRSQSAKR